MSVSSNSINARHLHLLDLPNEMLQEVMSYLTYDEIAKCRAVCKKFDQNNKQMLNRGYNLILSRLEKYENEIESTLPRRVSAQREHPRYKHYLASFSIQCTLEVLKNYYCPYIEKGVCCFIAGKVLDEALKALHSIKVTEKLPWNLFADVVRKYSGMARDHFQEVIEPSLKNIINNTEEQEAYKDAERTEDNFQGVSDSSLINIMNSNKAHNSNKLPMSSSRVSKDDTRSLLLSKSIEQKFCKSIESLHFRLAKNKVAVSHVKKQVSTIRFKMRRRIAKLKQQNREKDKQLKKLKKRLQLAEEK